MKIRACVSRLLLCGWCLLLGACVMQQPIRRADHRPVIPTVMPSPKPVHGGLYDAGTGLELFADVKARRVGDVITVILKEKTQASKKASTSTTKETDIALPSPTILGRDITLGGYPLFNNSVDSATDFNGEGDSSQSNSLTGDIAVTVAAVYPNGNMMVRGEKVLTLNQGSEVVRISGLVRAVDVTPANTVLSTQIADAQITYSGTGAIAQSNQQGWLARFFNSPYWPF
jgi:flagellar L-ring protein precursor FlgH